MQRCLLVGGSFGFVEFYAIRQTGHVWGDHAESFQFGRESVYHFKRMALQLILINDYNFLLKSRPQRFPDNAGIRYYLRILAYLVIFHSGQVSLDHFQLS